MKLTTEFKYGILIFFGIGIYFLLMEILGLSNLYFLRILNVFIIIYGLNLAIKSNLQKGKTGYLQNLVSTSFTGFIGIALGIIGLIVYLKIRGGEQYMHQLSKAFLFGGEPTIAEYSFGLFIEGFASVLMVAFINMQYWMIKNVFKEDVKISG